MAKSNNKIIDIEANVNWAKVFEINMDRVGYKRTPNSKGSYEDSEGAFTVQVELNDEAREVLEENGCAKDLKKDEIKVIRKNKAYDKKGDLMHWLCGPPVVARADGTDWDVFTDGFIGNGSYCVVRLELYEYEPGEFGTRLVGLQVLNHEPYRDEDGNEVIPEEGAAGPTGGFGDRSKDSKPKSKPEGKKAASKPKAKKEETEELNDEIPF